MTAHLYKYKFLNAHLKNKPKKIFFVKFLYIKKKNEGKISIIQELPTTPKCWYLLDLLSHESVWSQIANLWDH